MSTSPPFSLWRFSIWLDLSCTDCHQYLGDHRKVIQHSSFFMQTSNICPNLGTSNDIQRRKISHTFLNIPVMQTPNNMPNKNTSSKQYLLQISEKTHYSVEFPNKNKIAGWGWEIIYTTAASSTDNLRKQPPCWNSVNQFSRDMIWVGLQAPIILVLGDQIS